MTDNKVAPLGQFDTKDKTLDEILERHRKTCCWGECDKGRSGCYGYKEVERVYHEALEKGKEQGAKDERETIFRAVCNDPEHHGFSDCIKGEYLKGKQAGRDEQLLEDAKKTLPDFWKTLETQKEKIAALEKELNATIKARHEDQDRETEKIAVLEKEIKSLEDYKSFQTEMDDYEIQVKELKEENARLREALLFGIGMNVSAGFSSSIDEKEYAQEEKHIWNEFFRKAKKALEANSVEQEAGITEANIGFVEKDTLDKVNKALGALESALAHWDASPEKPEDLEPKFTKYRMLHDALVQWETRMLRSMDRELDFYTRVDRLKEFARICDTYQ